MEYAYFCGLLKSKLRSGDLGLERALVVRRTLDALADRVVTRKCGCGEADCKTFEFEYQAEEPVNNTIDIGPNVILFYNDDGEMHCLEQYPM